jgi:AAA+ ATPase superfamily predicted ATPase
MAAINGIIGRKLELEILDTVFKSDKSEFVILYGRRRVGKTFLINRRFGSHFTFRLGGVKKVLMERKLT